MHLRSHAPCICTCCTHAKRAPPPLYPPLQVSTLCWAFGRLRVPAPDLLDTLCARALPRLCQFTPQGLANTAWGLARAAHDAPEAFDAIAEEVRHSP